MSVLTGNLLITLFHELFPRLLDLCQSGDLKGAAAIATSCERSDAYTRASARSPKVLVRSESWIMADGEWLRAYG